MVQFAESEAPDSWDPAAAAPPTLQSASWEAVTLCGFSVSSILQGPFSRRSSFAHQLETRQNRAAKK